jgi:hypothetical protein
MSPEKKMIFSAIFVLAIILSVVAAGLFGAPKGTEANFFVGKKSNILPPRQALAHIPNHCEDFLHQFIITRDCR